MTQWDLILEKWSQKDLERKKITNQKTGYYHYNCFYQILYFWFILLQETNQFNLQKKGKNVGVRVHFLITCTRGYQGRIQGGV